MKIYKLNGGGVTAVDSLPDAASAVVLGNFDGVHRGHRALIDAAVVFCAENRGTVSIAWMFDDLPSTPESPGAPKLTPLHTKLELLSLCGLDYAVTESFGDIRDMQPDDFTRDILKAQLHARAVVCGFNFRFGKGGAGDTDTLRSIAANYNIAVTVIAPVTADGEAISSTRIRKLLASGDTEEAAKLLGRPYSIDFPVEQGKHLGRTIGLPTINQNFPAGYLIPAHGIYAVTCELGANDPILWLGAANIGVRPTVSDSGRINCETHIIGYSGDLYGRRIRVSFYRKIRDERKFDSVQALKEQIERDISMICEYFSEK